MSRRLTTEEFIERAKAVHGHRYGYSLVEYVKREQPVEIICTKHGPFRQAAHSHLAGRGCPDCSGRKRLTTEAFIEMAKAIHGDRYDYSQVHYVNRRTHVTIICPDHGPFRQKARVHTYDESGCPQCASKQLTTEAFIERARAVHGDRYDYSQVHYVNMATPVTIICLDHGLFEQQPRHHVYRENGCAECSGKNKGRPRHS